MKSWFDYRLIAVFLFVVFISFCLSMVFADSPVVAGQDVSFRDREWGYNSTNIWNNKPVAWLNFNGSICLWNATYGWACVSAWNQNVSINVTQNLTYWFYENETGFINLTDTPKSYAGNASSCVVVNSTATGLTFAPCVKTELEPRQLANYTAQLGSGCSLANYFVNGITSNGSFNCGSVNFPVESEPNFNGNWSGIQQNFSWLFGNQSSLWSNASWQQNNLTTLFVNASNACYLNASNPGNITGYNLNGTCFTLNGTQICSWSQAGNASTVYYADEVYLNKNASNSFNVNVTALNKTLYAQWLNSTGTTYNGTFNSTSGGYVYNDTPNDVTFNQSLENATINSLVSNASNGALPIWVNQSSNVGVNTSYPQSVNITGNLSLGNALLPTGALTLISGTKKLGLASYYPPAEPYIVTGVLTQPLFLSLNQLDSVGNLPPHDYNMTWSTVPETLWGNNYSNMISYSCPSGSHAINIFQNGTFNCTADSTSYSPWTNDTTMIYQKNTGLGVNASWFNATNNVTTPKVYGGSNETDDLTLFANSQKGATSNSFIGIYGYPFNETIINGEWMLELRSRLGNVTLSPQQGKNVILDTYGSSMATNRLLVAYSGSPHGIWELGDPNDPTTQFVNAYFNNSVTVGNSSVNSTVTNDTVSTRNIADFAGNAANTTVIIQSLVPTGTIEMYGGNTTPTGWLLCNGTSYSTATYAALYAVIGYNYGGSGANFNVPNMSQSFPRGTNNAVTDMGATGGHNQIMANGTIGSASAGTPAGTITTGAGSQVNGATATLKLNFVGTPLTAHSHSWTGTQQDYEPQYVTVNYIIKD